jgi:hypothetical protein
MCNENNIIFDPENQRVRCLTHIINLAAQDALKSLKGTGPDSEEEVLNNKNPIGVIAKVRFKYNLLIFIFIYCIILITVYYYIKRS